MLNRSQGSKRQKGVGLIELMVGMTVGLIIVGAAATLYITTLRGGSDVLRSAKLNMELRGAMDLMTSEMRRASYWPANGASLTNNPFTQTASNISSPDSSCILFAYDKNANGTPDSAEYIGFKLSSNAISMRYAGDNTMASNCSLGTWESLTDPNTVVVESLSFSIAYQCNNSKTNVTAAEPCLSGQSIYDAAAAAAGKTDLTELRLVTINLAAHHVSDADTRIQLTQTVFVRNSHIQTVGS